MGFKVTEGEICCITLYLVSPQVGSRLKETSYRKTESDLLNVVRNVSRYINNEAKVSGHKKYAYSFILYLCLHVINVIFNIKLLDIFIDGEFWDLGSRFVPYTYFLPTRNYV